MRLYNEGVRRFSLVALATAFLAVSALAGLAEYQSAKRKIDAIGTTATPPGTRVILSTAELNSYISGEIPHVAGPGAVTAFTLQLGEASGTVRARVDFLKVQQNTGRQPSWLLQKILEGQRDVQVNARLRSANGYATAWVDRVEVAGLPLSGPALDFLMQVFIAPQFPNIKLGQPFPLRPGVDHFEVHPQAVHVYTK